MDLMACVIFRKKKKKHQWERDERDDPSSIPSVVVASPEAPDLAPDFFAGGDSDRPIKEKKRKKKNKQDKR